MMHDIEGYLFVNRRKKEKKSDDCMINNELMKGLFNIFIFNIDVKSPKNLNKNFFIL